MEHHSMPFLFTFFIICLITVSESGAFPKAKKTQPSPTVEIPGLGKVVGDISYSHFNQRPFYQYKGIRYGVPPTGERRFKHPEPQGPWNGTVDATKFGRSCPQPSSMTYYDPWAKLHSEVKRELIKRGESFLDPTEDEENLEDCLFLHIYTPKLGVEAKLPVMVFIHGGAFIVGDAVLYGPQRFMDKDVVLVIPHYRLGPLGFLSLQTDDIPGNAGMLDQVLALEWVRDHISVFGGDPNLVTIFGESAGGCSVSYLKMSPLAKGLFHRVIAESGSALASWSLEKNPEFHGLKIAAEAGCNVTGTDGEKDGLTGVTTCLQTVDPILLINASMKYKNDQLLMGYNGFGGAIPVVQKAGKKRYITKPAIEMIKSGDYSKVPMMSGANRDDGTFLFSVLYKNYLRPNKLLDDMEFLSHSIPDCVLKDNNIEDPNFWLNDALFSRYTTPETLGNFTAMSYGIVDALGTMMFKGPQYYQMQLFSKDNNSYFYAFNYLGNSTLWPLISIPGLPIEGGVCHTNELMFLFDVPIVTLDEEEEQLSKVMINIWTNFAIYGKPNPEESKIEGLPNWLPYSYKNEFYMRIDKNITGQHDYTKEYDVGMRMHGMKN
ncbi:juvenile hormone esterase-like [Ischnura elegans]|uniref:juvenile hormone esterase-like n=1 Tax=Ischnura elegans TaxID=197161 RepID=UPI001ED889AE|nr:juvenile hormone esterase-like [Ischnura elegans]